MSFELLNYIKLTSTKGTSSSNYELLISDPTQLPSVWLSMVVLVVSVPFLLCSIAGENLRCNPSYSVLFFFFFLF